MYPKWKMVIQEGTEIFESKHAQRKAKLDHEKEGLEKKVGQLTMEIEYLKKKLEEYP